MARYFDPIDISTNDTCESTQLRKGTWRSETRVLLVAGWIEAAAQANATIQPVEAQEASVVGTVAISMDDGEASRRVIQRT